MGRLDPSPAATPSCCEKWPSRFRSTRIFLTRRSRPSLRSPAADAKGPLATAKSLCSPSKKSFAFPTPFAAPKRSLRRSASDYVMSAPICRTASYITRAAVPNKFKPRPLRPHGDGGALPGILGEHLRRQAAGLGAENQHVSFLIGGGRVES